MLQIYYFDSLPMYIICLAGRQSCQLDGDYLAAKESDIFQLVGTKTELKGEYWILHLMLFTLSLLDVYIGNCLLKHHNKFIAW